MSYRSKLFLGALVLVVSCTAAVGATWAQARPEDGSLAAVTAELRQLRVSVEASLRSQSETHAMGVLLAAEQGRVTELTARLDSVRAELVPASEKAREATDLVAWHLAHRPRVTDPAAQTNNELTTRLDKEAADKATDGESRLKLRESELMAALQTEEARWADLVTRLEQLIRR